MNPDEEEAILRHLRLMNSFSNAPDSEAARRWFARTGITPWTIKEAQVAEEEASELARTCIGCGLVCASLEALADHEADCL